MFGLAAMRAKSKATCTGFLLAFIFGGLASSEEGIECDPPWERVHHACLHFNTTHFQPWSKASEECNNLKADLLVIRNASEFANALQSKIKSQPLLKWWVGLNLREEYLGAKRIVTWTWVDKTAYITGLPHWASGELNGTRSKSAAEDCVSLEYQNNIRNEDCRKTLPYICEQNRVSSEEDIQCDPPWERVQRACLRFNTTNFRSWAGARKECKSIGAELLVISDDSEFNALQSKTSSSFPIARWWVGLALRAKHMGNPKIFDWTWVDETAYIKGLPRWAPGEPYGTRSTSATEDCVALDYQNNIKDEECIQSLPYICEKRIYNRSPEAKEELPILGLFWPLAVYLLVALCILCALCKKRLRDKCDKHEAQNTDQPNELVQPSNAPQESHDDNIVRHDAVPDDITERDSTINTSLQAQENNVELGSDSP